MEEILISVIVPIYDSSKYLHRCLDSIKNQTYENLEIILVDDGSTDNSGEIADEYAKSDKRFIVFHLSNQGVSHARNIGLDFFHGEYVSFVDSDDFIERRYIERLFYAIKKENTLISRCLPHDSLNPDIQGYENVRWTEPISINVKKEFDYTERYAYGPTWGTLFHKELVGDVRFDEDIFVGEDILFMAKMINRCDVLAILEEALYVYVIYEESACHGTYKEKNKTDLVAWSRMFDLFKEYPAKFKIFLNAKYCLKCCNDIRQMEICHFADVNWKKYVLKEIRSSLFYCYISNYSLREKIKCTITVIFPKMYMWIYRHLKK